MRLLLALAVACLSACASSSYRPINSNNPTQAAVYIIRQRAEPTAWNLWVYLDKEKVASLSNKSYVAIGASPGEHTLLLDWPPTASSVKLDVPLTLVPGTARYFEVMGRVQMTGMDYKKMHFNESIQFVELAAEAGKSLIDSLK